MKARILKLLKIFLVASVAVLVVVLTFGLVLLMQWPWWVALFLILLVAGLVIGAVTLWKVWARRREQRFVQEVLDQDESRVKAMSARERDDLRELQERWKEAVGTLRKSHLKKQGNPLYVLPWYLVVGESGSGKSITALSIARLLPSPPARYLRGHIRLDGRDVQSIDDAGTHSDVADAYHTVTSKLNGVETLSAGGVVEQTIADCISDPVGAVRQVLRRCDR